MATDLGFSGEVADFYQRYRRGYPAAVYRQSLTAAGYDVSEARVDYSDPLTLDQLVGGVYSAIPVDALPAQAVRRDFSEGLGLAVGDGPFIEDVQVRLLLATI